MRVLAPVFLVSVLLAPAAAQTDGTAAAPRGAPAPARAAGGIAGREGPGPLASPLAVIAGPLDPELTALVRRALPMHGDYGDFLLVRADAGQQRWLTERGLFPLLLGAWPGGRELGVVELHEVPGNATLLYASPRIALVAVDPESGVTRGCMHGQLVPAQPHRAARGFQRPAGVAVAQPLGASLGASAVALPGAQPGQPAGAEALPAADSRIAPLLPQVSAAAIEGTVAQLSSLFTRRADSAQVLQARDWILAQLAAIPGLTVTTDTFTAGLGPNIVATKTGSVHPERIVVLGAHYDSLNAAGSGLAAPGADDNASGSGGLLEVARLLAPGDYENTVRMVWFCAEEFGLLGAEAQAEELAAQNAQVLAMLNMDMIAHRAPGDARDLDFATNNTDPALVQFCRDITAAYVPELPTVTGVLTAGSSDHAAFNAQGFPAVFYFEDLGQFSSVIHTAGDTLPASANDFTLARQITQAFLAAAATIAAPVDIALAHAPLADTADAGGPYPLAASAVPLTLADIAAVEARVRVGDGVEFSVPLMASSDPATWVGSLPGLVGDGSGPLDAEVRYWLLATDSEGFQQWLPDALVPGAVSWSFRVGTQVTVYAQGFEGPGDAGWTHAQVSTQDDWQRGAPQGKGGDPSAAAGGSSVWGNDLGGSGWNGTYQPNVNNWLESPALDLTGRSGLHLRYQRWLTVEDAQYDQASIKVNGTTVWTNPATPGGGAHLLDGAWTLHDVDISAIADDNPSVRVRFGLQSDGGLEFGGWTIDDVQVAEIGPGVVPSLTASTLHVSLGSGSSVSLDVRAGVENAGRKYLLALSGSGSAPGTPFGFAHIPLNFDAVSSLGFQFLNTPLFADFGGFLDAGGRATATWLALPGMPAGAAGVSLTFAAFTLGPVDFATNAVTITLEP